MDKLLVPLGIIVLMSVLGYLTQLLKRAAERRQMERDRDRVQDRPRREAVRTGSTDIDRFLRAVDAQRQKGVPTARPAPKRVPAEVPTATPVRRPRLADSIAPTFPEAKSKRPATLQAVAADDLPVATVVSGLTAPVVTPPTQLAKPQRAAPAPTAPLPVTPFGRQFAGLLKGPDSLALAVALQEVLGPPKCKRG